MGSSSSKNQSSKTFKFIKRVSFRQKKKKTQSGQQVQQSTPVKNGFASENDNTVKNGHSVLESEPNTQNAIPESNTPVVETELNNHLKNETNLIVSNGRPSTPVSPLVSPKFPRRHQNGSVKGRNSYKEKSRSLKSLIHLRRTGSVKSNKSIGSTFSLRRFASLKSVGREKKSNKVKEPNEEDVDAEFRKQSPAEVPPAECIFVRFYESKLHLKIFSYLTLTERLRVRSVCRKWQTDVFKEQHHFVYPLFKVKCTKPGEEEEKESEADETSNTVSVAQKHQEQLRQAVVYSNKYLYWCPEVRSLTITDRLTRSLIDNLTKYCFSKLLSRLVFTVSTMAKCDIIPQQTLEQFSIKFGGQLNTIAVDARLPNGSINNDLTDVILFLLYTNSEHFENLVNFELQISNKLTNGYFQMFLSEFGAQLRHLSVAAHFDSFSNNFQLEGAKTLDRIGSTAPHLKSLKLALLPRNSLTRNDAEENPVSRIRANELAQSLSGLSQTITSLESFTLEVDIAEIDCDDLDLLEPMSRFPGVDSLSLVVYGDLKQLDQCKLNLNFAHLQANCSQLRTLTVDSAKLSDLDVERLVRCCPQLAQLTLRCDVRVTLTAMHQICNGLPHLTDLTITRCSGPTETALGACSSTSSSSTTTEALFIDTESLVLLLTSAPVTMTRLRRISLSHCRIDMEDPAVLDLLVSFTAAHRDELFSISLAHNRFPLMQRHKFEDKYSPYNYIPQNLQLLWS